MREVVKGLWVGDRTDYDEAKDRSDWSFVLAAQSFHRQLLGYSGRGAPKDSPDYLWHESEHVLTCNLVDADNPKFIDELLIAKILGFMAAEWSVWRTLGVFCDQGMSRSPTLCLLFLRGMGLLTMPYAEAAEWMDAKLEGNYRPNGGMKAYAQERWG